MFSGSTFSGSRFFRVRVQVLEWIQVFQVPDPGSESRVRVQVLEVANLSKSFLSNYLEWLLQNYYTIKQHILQSNSTKITIQSNSTEITFYQWLFSKLCRQKFSCSEIQLLKRWIPISSPIVTICKLKFEQNVYVWLTTKVFSNSLPFSFWVKDQSEWVKD